MSIVPGPGKIFGSFFIVAAALVAFTIVGRLQVSSRMERVVGKLADDSNGGGKAIYYTIGRVGTSRANSVNVKVRYQYVVNGTLHKGTILSLNGNSYAIRSEEKVKRIIDELSKSSVISVWYDPEHPEFSVIVEPQIDDEFLWLGLLLFLSLMSFKFLDRIVMTLKRKNRTSNELVHSDSPKGGA